MSQGEFIVRTHEKPTKFNDYLKEQWAMDAARSAGVPTPRVLEVGNAGDGRPYMISERVQGIDGRTARQRLDVIESLGRAAASLHTIRTRGFGPVFDWSSNTLSRHESWSQWLVEGFEVERRIGILVQHRMIDARQASRLRRRAAEMARWRKPPVLHHGDLRLKNAIVDADSGRLLAVLDWENCISAPAPFWDLSLALHDLGIDEKEAFLAGYGMKPRALAAAMPYLRAFNILNYAHPVESAVRKARRDRSNTFACAFRAGSICSIREERRRQAAEVAVRSIPRSSLPVSIAVAVRFAKRHRLPSIGAARRRRPVLFLGQHFATPAPEPLPTFSIKEVGPRERGAFLTDSTLPKRSPLAYGPDVRDAEPLPSPNLMLGGGSKRFPHVTQLAHRGVKLLGVVGHIRGRHIIAAGAPLRNAPK